VVGGGGEGQKEAEGRRGRGGGGGGAKKELCRMYRNNLICALLIDSKIKLGSWVVRQGDRRSLTR